LNDVKSCNTIKDLLPWAMAIHCRAVKNSLRGTGVQWADRDFRNRYMAGPETVCFPFIHFFHGEF
jgi:hypothetical protein